MSGKFEKLVTEALLEKDGSKLVNIKLLRGPAAASKEEIYEQVHIALTQKANGNARSFTNFPEDNNAKRVDLTQLR
jgi:hypothetical protein